MSEMYVQIQMLLDNDLTVLISLIGEAWVENITFTGR